MKKARQEDLLFFRMSGTQNTFLVANAFQKTWDDYLKTHSERKIIQMVQKVCGNYYGFKTDGVLFLKKHQRFNFAWLFYNSDGSKAEMCGNASRCASAFYYRYIKRNKKLTFLTDAGVINSKILTDKKVSVEMISINEIKAMKVLGKKGYLVNTGVPHFVLLRKPNIELARKLRQVKSFGKSGANITFAYTADTEKILAVTYERGVENFTQACGTGAVAVAAVTGKKNIFMPGGKLKVERAKVGQRPILTGPVRFEFQVFNWEES